MGDYLILVSSIMMPSVCFPVPSFSFFSVIFVLIRVSLYSTGNVGVADGLL